MPKFLFGSAVAPHQDYLVVSARVAEMEARGADHDVLLFRVGGKWSALPLAEPIAALNWDGASVQALTIDGLNYVVSASGVVKEVLDASADGPGRTQAIMGGAVIEGKAYACGMTRQVYRRDVHGWARADAGARLNDVVGFKAIAGVSESELYAVGFGGEIWSFDGAVWTQEDSPTSVKLECAVIGPDGDVYAAGGRGVVVRGRKGRWEVLENQASEDTIWDATVSSGRTCFSSDRGVRVVSENGAVEKLTTPFDGKITFGNLASSEGQLWSVGRLDIALFEGGAWSLLSLTDI